MANPPEDQMEHREPPSDMDYSIGRRNSLLCRLGFHSWEYLFGLDRESLKKSLREYELWEKSVQGRESEILAVLRKLNACRECTRCGLVQEHDLTFDVRGDMFCKRCGSYPDGRRTPGIRF